MNYNRQLVRRSIDGQRHTLMALLKNCPRPTRGWIGTIRFALGVSQPVLGGRLGVAKQRVSQLERREREGTIQLNQLQDVAHHLGCDLVYALVPREPLEQAVMRQARKIAVAHLSAVQRTMQLEGQETPITEERIRDYIQRHVDDKDLWET
nr:mobile mystery protein A [Hyphomicrobium sp. NDB2Meth4]